MSEVDSPQPPIIRHPNHETQWRYMVDEIGKITGVSCSNPPEAIDAVRALRTEVDTLRDALRTYERVQLAGRHDER